MPSRAPTISICFPAYNEEKTVYAVVEDAYHLAQKLTDDFEIVICNDGSRDRTLDELKRLQEAYPAIRIIHNGVNRGLAYTFARLYDAAEKDYVFLNATDGQWPNSILADMITCVPAQDIVVSVRRSKHYTASRAIISFLYNSIPILLFGVAPKDAGGVKLIARRFVYQGQIISKSPFADAERIIRAKKDGARIVYIPVDVRPRETGKSNAIKPRVLWQCFLDLFRVFFRLHLRK